MPKPSSRKITVPSVKPATAAKPATVLGAQAAAQATAGRSNVAAPASKPATAAAPVSTAAKPVRGVARTCSTIARDATNYGGSLSDRDNAYLAFYAGFAKRASNGIVTVADIATRFRDLGAKPDYIGSCKPHDAGVIVRLTKAGIIKHVSDGTSFTFTDTGKQSKLYASAKA